MSFLKQPTYRSEKWLKAVRMIPFCVRCQRYDGGGDAAHRNEGKAMASKVDDCLTARLCRACHMEIDQGKNMSRDERRAELDRCIVLTLLELVRDGKVVVK